MQPVTKLGTVQNLTNEQLEAYRAARAESDYVLVDVRQPEEYQTGHVPGARSIPLGDLERRAHELKQVEHQTVVFYCRSGGRSARASAWAAGVLGLPNVVNLVGGFSGYQGVSLPDFPRLKTFETHRTTEGILRQALDLEKGTLCLYQSLSEEFREGVVADTIALLAQAELAHGRAIHALLARSVASGVEPFEALFNQARGELIETGESWQAVADRARQLGHRGSFAVLELALEIEFTAYDLYKNLAETSSGDARNALMALAQEERQHAQSVLSALGRLAAHGGTTAGFVRYVAPSGG